jgi:glyceraldehyde 3-phosphate dehydrogenase
MDKGYRVAINGFGRIGRLVLRQLLDSGSDLSVVAVNDIAELDNLAYLLKQDSVYGEPEATVDVSENALQYGEFRIPYSRIEEPARLPWLDLDVDIVIEATGVITGREAATKHLDAGAERVIVTGSAQDSDPIICMGVNEDEFYPDLHRIIFSAGSTTNCVALVTKVLDEEIGIESGIATVMRAFSSSGATADSSSSKGRAERAAAVSIVPVANDAVGAIRNILPELSGKLDVLEIRVPVPSGSIVDFVIHSEQPTTTEQINEALQNAAETPELAGILGVRDHEPISNDIIGDSHSALIDLASTAVVRGHTIKVLAWYDSVWACARRVVDLAEHVAETVDRFRSDSRDQFIQSAP